MGKNNTVFLSAGEPSGDLLGHDLIINLLTKDPTIQFIGTGGPLMRSAGLQPCVPSEKFHISGFAEVFLSSPKLIKYLIKTLKFIKEKKPHTIITIDFPDYHMFLIRLLRLIKYKGKIIHYVCPSIWAWRSKRKAFLEKYVDLLLTILPFEQKLFQSSPLKTIYVGHPLLSEIEKHVFNDNWKQYFHIPKDRPIIAFFPGSRTNDVKRNLKIQIKSFLLSQLSKSHIPVIASSHETLNPIIKEVLQQEKCSAYIIPKNLRYELMQSADCALAKCGTIVLETALLATPTIVTCQLKDFDFFIAKHIFKILLPSYSLPNIILGKPFLPEYIGDSKEMNPEELATSIDMFLEKEATQDFKIHSQKLWATMSNNVSPINEAILD